MKNSNITSLVVFFIISFVVTFSILLFFVFEEMSLLKVSLISVGAASGGVLGSWVMARKWINSNK